MLKLADDLTIKWDNKCFFLFSLIWDVFRTKRDCNMQHDKSYFVSFLVEYVVFSDCLEKWVAAKVWWVCVEKFLQTKCARLYGELCCFLPSRKCYFVTYSSNSYHSMTLHLIWFVRIEYYSARPCKVKGLTILWTSMAVELIPMSYLKQQHQDKGGEEALLLNNTNYVSKPN